MRPPAFPNKNSEVLSNTVTYKVRPEGTALPHDTACTLHPHTGVPFHILAGSKSARQLACDPLN